MRIDQKAEDKTINLIFVFREEWLITILATAGREFS